MLVPATLPPTAGWHSGHTLVHACPGVAATRCVQATTWAATIRWRDCSECLPHETTAALPPGGIALQATVALERPRRLRRGAWPPTVRADEVASPFEGLPAHIGVYQHTARVHGTEVSVVVFFGRARPTVAQLLAAERILRRLRLP